jgi:hypothetical protein
MGQQSLCPQGNSKSPLESNTNSHIASIRLNRDRFNTVLMTLGGTSPSKNITSPDLLTDPVDKLAGLLPLQITDYDKPPDDEPQDCVNSTVRINKTPPASHQTEQSKDISHSHNKKRYNHAPHHDQSYGIMSQTNHQIKK